MLWKSYELQKASDIVSDEQSTSKEEILDTVAHLSSGCLL